jgi:hypothetical protein
MDYKLTRSSHRGAKCRLFGRKSVEKWRYPSVLTRIPNLPTSSIVLAEFRQSAGPDAASVAFSAIYLIKKSDRRASTPAT